MDSRSNAYNLTCRNNASWSLDKNNNPHEAGFLKLHCSKASNRLKWNPKWNLQESLKMIVNWHQNYLKGVNMNKECLKEIYKYKNKFKNG